MNERIPIGELIRKRREELGLSQEELAERLNVSRQSVSKWETGLAAPSRRNMEDLARALGFELRDELVLAGQSDDPADASENAAVSKKHQAGLRIAAVVLGIIAILFGTLWLNERAKNAAVPNSETDPSAEVHTDFPNNLEGLTREDCEELQRTVGTNGNLNRNSSYAVLREYLNKMYGFPERDFRFDIQYHTDNGTRVRIKYWYESYPDYIGLATLVQPLETGENGIWVVTECEGMDALVNWFWTKEDDAKIERISPEEALELACSIYPPEVTFVREADETLVDGRTGLSFPCSVWSVYVDGDLRSQIAIHSREKIWIQNAEDWPKKHDWSGAYRYGEGYAMTYRQDYVEGETTPVFELAGAPGSGYYGTMGPDLYRLYIAHIHDIEELTHYNEGGITWDKSTQTISIGSIRSTGTHTGAIEGMSLYVTAVKEGDSFRVTSYGTKAGPYWTHPWNILQSHFKIEITEARAAEIAAIAYDIITREIAKHE